MTEFLRNVSNGGGLFSRVSDENYRKILLVVGDNPRLSKPYDDRFLDGWSDYSYHKVFTAAWTLTTTLPATKQWAFALSQLLKKCLPPSNFDPIKALSRWYIDPPANSADRWPPFQYGFYLRTRIADLLKADDALLKADDVALRASFYRRFDPKRYPDWPTFAKQDGEEFLNGALQNKLIWKSAADREVLNRLCWDHPDPESNMNMPNYYRATEDSFRKEHPEWFSDA